MVATKVKPVRSRKRLQGKIKIADLRRAIKKDIAKREKSAVSAKGS